MNLEELYKYKTLIYHIKGIKEQPDKLLAMLLLSDMKLYGEINRSVLYFYRDYKTIIDKSIEKVIADFNFTEEELIYYIKKNYIEEYQIKKGGDFEFDKIWFAFGNGIGALQWGLLYNSNENPLDIYCKFFDDYEIENIIKRKQNVKKYMLEDNKKCKVKQKIRYARIS